MINDFFKLALIVCAIFLAFQLGLWYGLSKARGWQKSALETIDETRKHLTELRRAFQESLQSLTAENDRLRQRLQDAGIEEDEKSI